MKEYEEYFIYDKPVPYIANCLRKSKDAELHVLNIYPVKVIDYIKFHVVINCLLLEKNKIPDPKIIQMSYLDFLFYCIENDENGGVYASFLVELLKMCLHLDIDAIKYVKENGKVNLIINDIRYDKSDFDNIKNIICYQNIIDYDDSYIDPKVEKALKEVEEFKNRNRKKLCSLEEQIVCVMLALHETDETKIHNLTIRKFSLILRRYDFKLHYKIYKSASMSGFVEFKEEIDHWMSEISNKRYSDALIEYDQFKGKMKKVAK